MGATNPEKVKMVVKNMETFMPKVMLTITFVSWRQCLHRWDRFVLTALRASTLPTWRWGPLTATLSTASISGTTLAHVSLSGWTIGMTTTIFRFWQDMNYWSEWNSNMHQAEQNRGHWLWIFREAGGVVVDPTTGGQVDFLARSIIDNMTFDQKKVPQNNVDTLVKTF